MQEHAIVPVRATEFAEVVETGLKRSQVGFVFEQYLMKSRFLNIDDCMQYYRKNIKKVFIIC